MSLFSHFHLRPAVCRCLLVGLLTASAPAYSADVKRGEALARTWCAHCHIVAADQEQVSDSAPAFAEIANKPGRTKLGVTVWLNDPHPPMPNLNLSQDEIEDLSAYIRTLKKD